MRIQTIFAIIASLFLLATTALGKEHTKSKLEEAIEYANYGQFDKSDSICNELLQHPKTSKSDKASCRALQCRNAWLAGCPKVTIRKSTKTRRITDHKQYLNGLSTLILN